MMQRARDASGRDSMLQVALNASGGTAQHANSILTGQGGHSMLQVGRGNICGQRVFREMVVDGRRPSLAVASRGDMVKCVLNQNLGRDNRLKVSSKMNKAYLVNIISNGPLVIKDSIIEVPKEILYVEGKAKAIVVDAGNVTPRPVAIRDAAVKNNVNAEVGDMVDYMFSSSKHFISVNANKFDVLNGEKGERGEALVGITSSIRDEVNCDGKVLLGNSDRDGGTKGSEGRFGGVEKDKEIGSNGELIKYSFYFKPIVLADTKSSRMMFLHNDDCFNEDALIKVSAFEPIVQDDINIIPNRRSDDQEEASSGLRRTILRSGRTIVRSAWTIKPIFNRPALHPGRCSGRSSEFCTDRPVRLQRPTSYAGGASGDLPEIRRPWEERMERNQISRKKIFSRRSDSLPTLEECEQRMVLCLHLEKCERTKGSLPTLRECEQQRILCLHLEKCERTKGSLPTLGECEQRDNILVAGLAGSPTICRLGGTVMEHRRLIPPDTWKNYRNGLSALVLDSTEVFNGGSKILDGFNKNFKGFVNKPLVINEGGLLDKKETLIHVSGKGKDVIEEVILKQQL
ncbi:hypothetical protein MA16_Dca006236 [Dendrobium catenatum]|uniref:Uncharacterized protein n=1 Tax=Dendrobium catenatum TaxID=906689 RepID=A0A2I0W994_9ASPA|nr:hypothetical protein MA16_Dca006236 [Dendrobium catenatum]